MDQYTKCVLNGDKMYSLEKALRSIASFDGTYVISVFDCCREVMEIIQSRGVNTNNFQDVLDALDDDTN